MLHILMHLLLRVPHQLKLCGSVHYLPIHLLHHYRYCLLLLYLCINRRMLTFGVLHRAVYIILGCFGHLGLMRNWLLSNNRLVLCLDRLLGWNLKSIGLRDRRLLDLLHAAIKL